MLTEYPFWDGKVRLTDLQEQFREMAEDKEARHRRTPEINKLRQQWFIFKEMLGARTIEHVLEAFLDKLVRPADEVQPIDLVELCRHALPEQPPRACHKTRLTLCYFITLHPITLGRNILPGQMEKTNMGEVQMTKTY